MTQIIAVEDTQFGGFVLPWVLTKEGRKAVRGVELVKALGKQEKEASRLIQMNVFPDYRFQSSFGEAVRPSWYVYEQGAIQLATRLNTPECEPFQRWVFDVVVKLFASGYYVLPTATSEQLEAAQKEIEKLKQKEQWLRQKNQKLIDFNELMWEGELRQLVKLFVKFAVKEYTSGKNYEYPIQFLDNFSITKPPYSFERYWLAYWKMFKKYSRIPGMPCEYSGALDLDSLNLWRILQEVNVELSNSGDYRKLKHQGCQINFNNYTQSLKALELS